MAAFYYLLVTVFAQRTTNGRLHGNVKDISAAKVTSSLGTHTHVAVTLSCVSVLGFSSASQPKSLFCTLVGLHLIHRFTKNRFRWKICLVADCKVLPSRLKGLLSRLTGESSGIPPVSRSFSPLGRSSHELGRFCRPISPSDVVLIGHRTQDHRRTKRIGIIVLLL